MSEEARSVRIASVVAATAVALASGTNYAFSAWGPEFGKHLKLSATDANILGVAANLGMYATGVPAGYLVDKKGPRWGIALGTIALACGYFPLHSAYELGADGMSLGVMSFFSFLTGLGSCSSFSAAIKTATVNWPLNRGTATAFPLAGFGLSAFFFATIASFAFGDNIGDFLLMLSVGTLCLNVGALPFMILAPPGSGEYSELPAEEEYMPGFEPPTSPSKLRHKRTPPRGGRRVDSRDQPSDSSETGSLIARTSSTEADAAGSPNLRSPGSSHDVEAPGFKVLSRPEFWQLFGMLALLAGVGLMTINNIGNNVKALIRHWDSRATPQKMQSQEKLHVSILSLGSFAGRLSSGIGSDFLIKRLRASRFWCLVASACIFTIAQVCALAIRNPSHVFFVSSLTGLGYGALFGVFPALVADTFGVQALSFNWGVMIIAPVLSGSALNAYYGFVYDDHSHVINDGSMDCPDGIDCFALAYRVSLISSVIAVAMALWCIRHQQGRTRARVDAMQVPTTPLSPRP